MMKIIKIFKSKKHNVCKVSIEENIYVLKEYSNKHSFIKEYDILNFLASKHLNVPEILANDGNQLYLDYIKGMNFLDYFTELEIRLSEGYEDFLNRFADFHRVLYQALREYKKDTILGDMNFRNYIIMGKRISRIDFEDCTVGAIETDIGKMAAFALTYDPSFTIWKKKFSRKLTDIFSDKLNLSKEKIITAMEKELDDIRIRRKW